MPIAGYAFCIALLTAGYYYNLTFVQRGLIDLGTTRLGMAGCSVSLVMALLAQAFVAWVVICAGSIGAAMPVTFSFMADLVPVRDRGFVAAVPAGLSFSVASLYPQQWRIEEFSIVMAVAMAPALVVLAALAFRPSPLVDRLARQRARFGSGRFTRAPAPSASTSAFVVIVAAMFAVFFIDSLGFLRIIDTPAYISTSWQSPDPAVRMFIGGLHVAGAAMAGVLYTTFHWRWLLVWVYGLFGFTHLLYTFHLGTAAGAVPPLLLPGMYVLAVSFYTTLNFALWPDLSTDDTIGIRCAVGVGVAGWLASFLSTSLALYSDAAGVSLLAHLRYVDALALLLLAIVPLLLYAGRVRSLAHEARS